MKLLRSGIEVDAEKLKESGIGKWVNHCCLDIPVGCIGQPGGCGDWNFPGLKVRDTKPNHREKEAKHE